MGRTTRMGAGVVGLALSAALTMGVGTALAQDNDDFYPATPEVDVADESEVLPATEEQPAGAPDAAEVQAEALAATGIDTAVLAVAGLGALALGGAAVGITRRRGVRA